MIELVKATSKSKPMTPEELADKFHREGKPLETIRMPAGIRYETRTEKRKRLWGVLGTKSVSRCMAINTTEEVAVWPIHPLDFLDHDDLFRRYLAPDGRVYEHDMDY